MNIDVNYFPGFTRKAITFTMDDGNVRLDKKFIDIIKPYGILGTFNLTSADNPCYTPEDYRRIYEGYEIANHCKNHPYALDDSIDYLFSDDVFDADSAIEDGKTLYRDSDIEGVWWLKNSENRWGKKRYATNSDYIRFIEEAQKNLEEVFGVGAVGAFVWPYSRQRKNAAVCEYIDNSAFYAVRANRNLADTTGFAMPTDRKDWGYNAGFTNLLEVAEKFDACPDDGELKLFAFGIHSHDYENNNRWDDMRTFAKKYGNRPEDFWYATNREIFEYEDALRSVITEDGKITNPTEKKLYIKVDGQRFILEPKSSLEI